jgi:hypothetical protein
MRTFCKRPQKHPDLQTFAKTFASAKTGFAEGYELKTLRKKTATFADVACEDCEASRTR